MSDERLEGRKALVTGAGSGNGAAIARRLAQDGADVVLLDRDEHGLERTLASWPDLLRGKGSPRVADITDDAEIEQVFAGLDRLEILVNNAGIVDPATFPGLDAQTFAHVLDVNLLGAYRCTRAAHPLLTRSGHGRVVNITSMEAHYLLATSGHVQPHYNASKAGLDLLTRALAYEMAGDGITVNAIAPGVIETALTSQSLADSSIADWIVDCVPAGRVGRPEDIAAVAAFLASDDAEYVTGISVPVDGGFTLGWFRKGSKAEAVAAAPGVLT
jgi:NAD(P)-dependent dehydrogenase (short-subunit alcohol dehydrogenase family)